MLKTTVLTFSCGLFLPFLCGCSENKTEQQAKADAGKLHIVSTIFPFTDWAREVGGDHVSVTTLLPNGTSPHTFEPTAAELRHVEKARLFLIAGLGMDDWAARVSAAASSDIEIVRLGDYLKNSNHLPPLESTAHSFETDDGHAGHAHHDHEGVNPHFWLDPALAILSVKHVAEKLGEIDPRHATEYNARAAEFAAHLTTLDAELSRTLAACAGRPLVTFHDSFPYFAKRYNLKIAGVIEEYAGKEPSDNYLKSLTNHVRELGVKVIFSEPQLSPRIAQVLAEEVGAKVSTLDPYGSETPGGRDQYGNLLRSNAGKIKAELCPLTASH